MNKHKIFDVIEIENKTNISAADIITKISHVFKEYTMFLGTFKRKHLIPRHVLVKLRKV